MTPRVAPAWLLEYRPGRFAAFALHSTLALLDRPGCAFVPGTPAHCLGLIRWEGRRLPLLDLGAFGDAVDASERADGDEQAAHALVLAWRQAGEGEAAELGALAAPRRVQMIEVHDTQQCDAPADCGMLQHLAASWFEHQGHPVAVVDTTRLFSGFLADARAAG